MTQRQSPSYIDKLPYFFREPTDATDAADFRKKSFKYTVRQLWVFVAFNAAFSILWAAALNTGGKYSWMLPRWIVWLILAVPSIIVTLTAGLALLYLISKFVTHPVVFARRVLLVVTILFMIVILKESAISECRSSSKQEFYCPYVRAVFF